MPENTITTAQCRAGRGLLDWSQSRLAAEARIAVKSVADFEHGLREARFVTADAIRRALEAAGVAFVADGATSPEGGPGVRLRAGGKPG